MKILKKYPYIGSVKRYYKFINEELNILKGPTDEETDEVFNKMNPDESLIWSINNNLYEYFIKSIKNGADVNINEFSSFPLISLTVRKNNFEMTKYLLKYGVNVNVVDDTGNTPFSIAYVNTYYPIMELLLENGADINCKNIKHDLLTPLLDCTSNRVNFTMIKFLVEHDADVNVKDKEGRPPLFFAIYYKKLEIVKYLVEHGASLIFNNKYYKNAYDFAKLHDFDIADYLKSLQ
jgi:ankyrin repeat protein